MVELVNFGKPQAIHITCPRCSEHNSFPIMTLGDIIGRKIICKGCAKEFKAFVHWIPQTWTEKDYTDDIDKKLSIPDSGINVGSCIYKGYR